MRTLSKEARDYLRELIETDYAPASAEIKEDLLEKLEAAEGVEALSPAAKSAETLTETRAWLGEAIKSARYARNLAQHAGREHDAGRIDGALILLRESQRCAV